VERLVRWRGMTAGYTQDERLIMAALPVKEQAVVHTLKAFTEGEISGAENRATSVAVSEARLVTQSRDAVPEEVPSPYTDPEDIEFGSESPKRRPKVYAVAWTWRQSRVHKTKKRCEQRLKVWKRWYERQGWKVYRMGSGFLAECPDGERHAITLHEYDRETKERLN